MSKVKGKEEAVQMVLFTSYSVISSENHTPRETPVANSTARKNVAKKIAAKKSAAPKAIKSTILESKGSSIKTDDTLSDSQTIERYPDVERSGQGMHGQESQAYNEMVFPGTLFVSSIESPLEQSCTGIYGVAYEKTERSHSPWDWPGHEVQIRFEFAKWFDVARSC